jgi:putative transposase
MSAHWPFRPRNHRLDPALYQQANRVTFMTVCAVAGAAPFRGEALNRALIDLLREAQALDRCQVYTYCLMPDHLHYLLSPGADGCSVLTFTDRYKGRSTKQSWSCGWRGRLWQARYYDHLVRAEEDLRAIAAYILDNPVRKGLCARPEA